jgi:hypothetical protein
MSLAFTISQGPKSLPVSSVSSTVPISQSMTNACQHLVNTLLLQVKEWQMLVNTLLLQ